MQAHTPSPLPPGASRQPGFVARAAEKLNYITKVKNEAARVKERVARETAAIRATANKPNVKHIDQGGRRRRRKTRRRR